MSKLKVVVVIAIILAIFIFTACTHNNDDGALTPGIDGFFNYDGTIYSLTSAIIRDQGANTESDESGYDLDFYAASSEET